MSETLDPHAKRLLALLALQDGNSAAAMSLAERRAAFRGLMRFSGPAEAVGGIEGRGFPGPGGARRVRIYTPSTTDRGTLPGLVFFHGGGLVAGDLETHDPLCRALANEARCRLVAVDYRLAPDHPFPAAIDDACAATLWVFGNAAKLGIDCQRIGVGGDSAGGTLAALVSSQMRGNSSRKLAFQLLLCPILDFTAQTPSRSAFAGPLLDEATLAADIAFYAAGAVAPDDPRVSPLRAARFDGLPPTILLTGGCDPLRDEGQIYAERLREAGVAVRHTVHQGMPHLFYALGGVIPGARSAVRQIGAQIRELLGHLPGLPSQTDLA